MSLTKKMLLAEGLWIGEETPEIIEKLESRVPINVGGSNQLRIVGRDVSGYVPGSGFFSAPLKSVYLKGSLVLPTEIITLDAHQDKLTRLAMLY